MRQRAAYLGDRMHLAVPSHVAPTREASKYVLVTLSAATKALLALVQWQQGRCRLTQ